MSEKASVNPVNPISLELFRSALTAIAEEMGVVLTRSSYSPNIKERLDFSCALFDGGGRLVAQAAHIPVHLGSLPRAVEAAIARGPCQPRAPRRRRRRRAGLDAARARDLGGGVPRPARVPRTRRPGGRGHARAAA